MARRSVPVLALLVAVVAAAAAARAEASRHYGASKFAVTGTVLCQDCAKNWNAYAYNARPIPGSVVAVTCLAKRTGKMVYHGTDTTDSKGAFTIEVPYLVHGCELEATDCVVRLASSGDAACAVLTNFNGGKEGDKPSRCVQNGLGDVVVYAVGPYYAAPAQCDVKDKDDDDDDVRSGPGY
ncbi:hypothetical protein ACP4OV_002895 [Aristida adscensionis]